MCVCVNFSVLRKFALDTASHYWTNEGMNSHTAPELNDRIANFSVSALLAQRNGRRTNTKAKK